MPARLLIVEDSLLVVDALTMLLESAAHEVRSAATVAEAVRQCRAAAPDVMLLDLSLPDGEGLQVLDAVRGTDAEPGVTVALTGHDDDATVRRCLAAGCRAVLLKPVSTRELLQRVAEWGEESRVSRES